jgi:hypothetical protein
MARKAVKNNMDLFLAASALAVENNYFWLKDVPFPVVGILYFILHNKISVLQKNQTKYV